MTTAANSSSGNNKSKDLYDYINEINQLESNLKERLVTQKNIEKPVCGLITELLLEAEISHCMGLSRSGETTSKDQKKLAANKSNETGSVEDDLSFKKSGLYRLLAIKLASMIEWNLYTLEKEVPLKLLYKLLETFIVLTTDSEMTTVGPDQNTLILDLAKLNRTRLGDMERHTLFAKHLFNRWCLRVYIFSRYPINWPKSLNPVSHMKCGRGISSSSGVNSGGGISDETITRKIASLSEDTVQCLSELVQYLRSGNSLYRPSSECIRKINLMNGTFSLDWISPHGLIPVDTENLAHSVSYDLGLYYFIQDEYKKSLGYLELVKEYRNKISSDQVKLNELNQWASELDGYLIACREAIHSHSSDKLNTKVILLQNIMDDFKKSFVTDQLKYLNRFDLHKLLTESVVTAAAASVTGGAHHQLKASAHATTLSVSGRISCTYNETGVCGESGSSVQSGAVACEQILASIIDTRSLFVADTESEEDDDEDYDDEEGESSGDEEKKSEQGVVGEKDRNNNSAAALAVEASTQSQSASNNNAKKKSTAQKKKEKKKMKKLLKADEKEKQKRQFEIELKKQQEELERLRKQNVELEAKLSSLKNASPSVQPTVSQVVESPSSKKAKKAKKKVADKPAGQSEPVEKKSQEPESTEVVPQVTASTTSKKKKKKNKNKKATGGDGDVSLVSKSHDESITKQSEQNEFEELDNSFEEEEHEQFHSAYTTNSTSHQQAQAAITVAESNNKKSLGGLEDFADTDEESYLRQEDEIEPESFELSINNDEYLPSSSSSSSTSSTSSSSYMSTCQSNGKQPVMAAKHYLNTLDEFEDFDGQEFESEAEVENNNEDGDEEQVHDDDENIDQIYLSLYKLRGNPKIKNSSPSSVSSQKISKRKIKLNELDSFSEDSPTKQMTKTSSSSSLNIMDNISRKVASLRVSNTKQYQIENHNQITQTLIIPVEKCSYLVSVRPNGLNNLKAIENLTGAKLEIQNASKKAQKSVLISGSSNEIIEFAQELVENLINNTSLVDLTTLLNNSPVKPKQVIYSQPLRANMNQLNRPMNKLPSSAKKALPISKPVNSNPWGVNKVSSNVENAVGVTSCDVKPLNFAQVVAQKPLEKTTPSRVTENEEESVIPTNLLDNIGHMWPFANQASLPPPSIHIPSPSISPAPVSLISAASLLDPTPSSRLSPFMIDTLTSSATNTDDLILTPTTPPITIENESNSISKALLSSLGILDSNSATNLSSNIDDKIIGFERPTATLIPPPPGLLPPSTFIGSSLDGLFNCQDENFSIGSTLEQTTAGSNLLDIHDTELNKLVTSLISSNNLSPEMNESAISWENSENKEPLASQNVVEKISEPTPSSVLDPRKPLVQLKAGTMNANTQNVVSKVNSLNLLAQKVSTNSQTSTSSTKTTSVPLKPTNPQLTVNTNPKMVNKSSSTGNTRVMYGGYSAASPTGLYHQKSNEWSMGYGLHSPHHAMAPSPQLSPTIVQLNRQGQPTMAHFHHQMPPPPPPPFFAHHLHAYGPAAPPPPPGVYTARLASPSSSAYSNRLLHPSHHATSHHHQPASVIYPGYNPTSQFYHMNLINHNMFPY